jgi:hypothetical protein
LDLSEIEIHGYLLLVFCGPAHRRCHSVQFMAAAPVAIPLNYLFRCCFPIADNDVAELLRPRAPKGTKTARNHVRLGSKPNYQTQACSTPCHSSSALHAKCLRYDSFVAVDLPDSEPRLGVVLCIERLYRE